MAQFTTDQLRNVALLGHSATGKTSLGEAALFVTKAINRLGRVEDGNTVADYEPEEHKRQTSLQVAVLPCVRNTTKINLLDTPGYADFIGETVSALRVADAAVLVVSAPAGVEVGTQQMWRRIQALSLPTIVFVNKIDRENVDLDALLDQLRSQLGRQCVAVNIPLGVGEQFKDVIDLLGDNVPAEAQDAASQYREQLAEAVAETNDDLTEKYLEAGDLTPEELTQGLSQGVRAAQVVPVLFGSATQGKGIEALLDAILAYLPSPGQRPAAESSKGGQVQEVAADSAGPLAALVFKTAADPFVGKLSYFRVYGGTFKANGEVWNSTKEENERVGQLFVASGKSQESVPELAAGDIGSVPKLSVTTTGDTLTLRANPRQLAGIEFPTPSYSVAISPKSKADLDKMSIALTRLGEEDPSVRMSREAATGEFIVSGIGDTHVEVLLDKAKRKFGVELELTVPKVAYRETITKVTKVEYRHKKQTGGHGQYGHVLIRLEPYRGQGYQFGNEVTGGNVPRDFIPSVEKGVSKAMEEGAMAGFPIVDVKVVLYDGSSHPVDSSGSSFEIAGSMALKKGVLEASPALLEPVMHLEVSVPESYAGDVIGDLNSRRAKIAGMSPGGGTAVIEAVVPQSEVQQYATTLRALTQGRGSFTLAFDHYEEVPAHLASKIVEAAKQ